MTNAPTTFDLNQHTARLLLDEPFFAALSRRMDKRVLRRETQQGHRSLRVGLQP